MGSCHRVYTEGPVARSLVTLALPIVFTNILQTAYHLTDTFWLGRLGAAAVAAVSLSFPVFFMILSLGGGLAMAGTILVSQHAGRCSRAGVDHVASQTILLLAVAGTVLSVVGLLAARPVLGLFPVEAAVGADALVYLRVVFAGSLFLFFYFAFQSLHRGVGNVRLPMYIAAGTVLLNLVLDPLFIFGFGFVPPLGVAGAAVATLATQGLAALLGLFIMVRGRYGIRLRRADLRPDPAVLRQVLRLGLPVSAEQFTVALGMFAMVSLVTAFGTGPVAVYGIGMRVFSFAIIPALGFAQAVSTLVGQNMGAGKVARAAAVGRTGALVAFWVLGALGLLLFIFAGPVTVFFIPGDRAVVAQSGHFIRIMALTYGFVGVKLVIGGVLGGSGNTRTAMFLSLAYLWALRVPFAWVLSRYTALGVNGLWWSFPAANLLGAVLAVGFYRHGAWRHKRLLDEGPPAPPPPAPATRAPAPVGVER